MPRACRLLTLQGRVRHHATGIFWLPSCVRSSNCRMLRQLCPAGDPVIETDTHFHPFAHMAPAFTAVPADCRKAHVMPESQTPALN